MQTVSLKCSNCGSNLSVQPDIVDLACGYCGASLTVERDGGAIYLRHIATSISQVRLGTDKTAAELAIQRLEKEIAAVEAKIEKERLKFESQRGENGTFFVGLSLGVIFVGLCLFAANFPLLGALDLIGGFAGTFAVWNRKSSILLVQYQKDRAFIVSEYDNLKEKMASQRAIAES